MSGWLPLVVHLAEEGDPAQRELERRLDGLGERVVNQTPLLESGERVGSLVALSRESSDASLELADELDGRVRSFRVIEELVVASDDELAGTGEVFASLAANLEGASLHFDDPAVSGAMRAALGAYLPALGRRLLGTSSLMVGSFDYAGALTAFEADSPEEAAVLASHDTWASIYQARLFGVAPGFFARNPAPPGPVIQRYQNVPWPGGRFS
jgi:hypothetical protein